MRGENVIALAVVVVLVTVHPRMRGENAGGLARRVGGGGSSPHARGKRLLRRVVLALPGRFIPACAGKTVLERTLGH